MIEEFDICMIVHNDVIHDGRVLKEASSLARHGWKVAVLGISLGRETFPEEEIVDDFTIFRITPKLFRGMFPGRLGLLLPLVPMIPAMSLRLRKINARIYHAHDFPGLFQLMLTGMLNRPFIYDSHELYFDRPLPDLPRPIEWLVKSMRFLEKPMAKRSIGMITVNESIATILSEKLNVPYPVVLRNVVDIRRLLPSETTFPTSQDQKIIVHTGNLAAGRNLPELVSSLQYLPEHIIIVFLGNGPVKPDLQQIAQTLGISHRITYIDPVSPYAVSNTIAQADLGAIVTTNKGKNNELALPNKLFESIAAGLPIVTSSNLEIANIVSEYNIGSICNASDPKSIASSIEFILGNNYEVLKQNVIHAREDLNWENEEGKLLALYEPLLK